MNRFVTSYRGTADNDKDNDDEEEGEGEEARKRHCRMPVRYVQCL